MELHKLLGRQLNHCGLTQDSLPTNLESWALLIKRINNFYNDTDQERYLLDRSVEISSHEMMQLNEKLETAQHIAGLGYWRHDKSGERIQLSKEIYRMLGLEPNFTFQGFDSFISLIHGEDASVIKKLEMDAWKNQSGYECELRIKNSENIYSWYYMIARFQTEENHSILCGTLLDITKRKLAEEEIDSLHQQLVETARQAGMADVATSVLHNAGNILNSSNVSLNLLQEKLQSPCYHNLFAALNMIKDHSEEVTTYLSQDPKGKLIPQYLLGLSDVIQETHNVFTSEINNLSHSLNHLKEVIAKQQSNRKSSVLRQKFYLPEIIDNAIEMCQNIFLENGINLKRNYHFKPFLISDKSSLVQILVNIFQNAKDAILENSDGKERKIVIHITKMDDDKNVSIAIKDSGIGMSAQTLEKIFTWGFTTKPDGHGFGLHNCVLKAKELGGILNVNSLGQGKGAEFTLSLPL